MWLHWSLKSCPQVLVTLTPLKYSHETCRLRHLPERHLQELRMEIVGFGYAEELPSPSHPAEDGC